MVYRGYNNANANGGVSYANASNDASNANANIGSRLTNYQSAYNDGDVSPMSCRGWQATAKAILSNVARIGMFGKYWKAEKSSVG